IKHPRLDIKGWVSIRLSTHRDSKGRLIRFHEDWDLNAEAGHVTDFDINKREEWLMDLQTLHQLERDDIKQRSRVRWAVKGDENSRFFHSLLRNKFAISPLKERAKPRPWFRSLLFRKLSNSDAPFLGCDISMEEVRSAVWSCSGTKSARPDGLNFNFIKAYWDILKTEFFSCIKYFETTGSFAKGSLRLAKVIFSIIGPNQTAFLAGRQILDGCLIANEVIRISKNEDHKLLLFKVDFEKAFDSVCWNFLLAIMTQMRFGDKWRRWITSCLCSASISVLINFAEALQISIIQACNTGLFNGVSLVDGGSNISLLQYADDALVFGKWSRSTARNLILILKCFEEASRFKINLSKSRLFGVGVNSDEVEAVASSLNCSYDSIPFMLSARKAKSLSIRGRLTLVKSVLGSIPIYFHSLFKASMKIISLRESLRRRFFWGFKEEQRGISWVKWDSILASPKFGGLGVGSLPAKNLGLLRKWKWRFLS
nr:putative RNA-directed DNA polymerase, eukaryota, reverse transcriptase zinc-binding domain protein [Tanacetum cinerariifolium]